MRRILLLIAIVSMVFMFTNTAHAVLGVVDDVPGTDVVFPIICEKGGTLNTLYAIANIFGTGATADLLVFDRKSNMIYDDVAKWTPGDVLSGDCQSLVAGMSAMQKSALEVTIGGKTYYVGYVEFINDHWPDNDQFISWVYLVDLPKGFASGFNGFQAEGYLTDELCEYDSAAGTAVCQVALALFPRYFILNDKPDTSNWWILVYGDNDNNRTLDGMICNEDEHCISLSIRVPNELNIIDVGPYVPAALHSDYPKAGFGWFWNNESDFNNTVYGFSYQRAQGNSVAATWDVIHPIHGWYY